eukprot:6173952-Pleurochrysis_carterae.AAC.2
MQLSSVSWQQSRFNLCSGQGVLRLAGQSAKDPTACTIKDWLLEEKIVHFPNQRSAGLGRELRVDGRAVLNFFSKSDMLQDDASLRLLLVSSQQNRIRAMLFNTSDALPTVLVAASQHGPVEQHLNAICRDTPHQAPHTSYLQKAQETLHWNSSQAARLRCWLSGGSHCLQSSCGRRCPGAAAASCRAAAAADVTRRHSFARFLLAERAEDK